MSDPRWDVEAEERLVAEYGAQWRRRHGIEQQVLFMQTWEVCNLCEKNGRPSHFGKTHQHGEAPEEVYVADTSGEEG